MCTIYGTLSYISGPIWCQFGVDRAMEQCYYEGEPENHAVFVCFANFDEMNEKQSAD